LCCVRSDLVLVAAVVIAAVAIVEMMGGHVVAALEAVAVVIAQAAGDRRVTEELGAVGVGTRALLEVAPRGLNAVVEATACNIRDDVVGWGIPAAAITIAVTLLTTVALLRRRRAILLCMERKGRGCAQGQHQKRRGKT